MQPRPVRSRDRRLVLSSLDVERQNAATRVTKPVPQAQVGEVNGKLGEVGTLVQDVKKKLDDLGKLLDAHQQKLTEAKNRH